MRPLRHNFFEVVSWVAAFFVAYWGILVSNLQQMRRSETCTRFISPVPFTPCWRIAFANVRLSEMQRVPSCHRISP